MTRLANLLSEAGHDGLTRDELLTAARARIREQYSEAQLDREILRLGSRVTRNGDRLRLADVEPGAVAGDQSADASGSGDGHPLRVVVFDIETTTELDPSGSEEIVRTIYQVAARRVGSDPLWIDERPRYSSYVRLPDEKLHLVRHGEARTRVQAAAPLTEVLAEFARFVATADVVLSYNGTSFDVELLKSSLHTTGHSLLSSIRWADALMLAISLYELPLGRSLSLAPLVTSLGWTGDPQGWHDATFDTDLLVWLIHKMAADLARLPLEISRLVLTVARGSPAWDVMRSLEPTLPKPASQPEGIARTALRTAVDQRAAVRGVQQSAPPQFLPPAFQLDNDPSTLNLSALVRALRDEKAESRPGQQRMLAVLRGWARGREHGLLEAPTGVGKSYALLGVALEWLAANPDHRVLISTFTKQLQNQLREDIARLEVAGFTGALGWSDVVKGKANRLSLRALLFALEDLTATVIPSGRTRARAFARDVRYRELLVYLLLRFLATPALISSDWLRLSVDPQDLHPFVSEYLGQRQLAYYLKHLSQALAGEMGSDPAEPLSRHTSTVREALTARRLVIVNHALLFANLDDITQIGPNTLLLVDEAHVLEAAATDALSATLDQPGMEAVIADFDRWVDEQPASQSSLRVVRESVMGWIEGGLLRRTVRTAFGALPVEQDTRKIGRKLVIASPVEGMSARGPLSSIRTELRAARDSLYSAYKAVQDAPPGRTWIDEDRRSTLATRLREISAGAREIFDRMQQLDVDPEANWVVWAEEILPSSEERLYETGEDFRFRVIGAPIEVARDARFIAFAQRTFPATAYVSATLKVTGTFEFVRSRLGLTRERVNEDDVATSFDFAKQALLVCMSDFPSWQEQSEAACRTVAQQVHLFQRAVGRPGENGVMVMTTARATAAAIGGELERLRYEDRAEYAIHHQLLRGTGQAVTAFAGRLDEVAAEAGVLVGTKGLWQGVDVADDRVLRMIWINKLPFASPADPLIASRLGVLARRLTQSNDSRYADPFVARDEATRQYYLPLAAIELRQAIGRLIRSDRHRGVVVISDRKLDGPDRWRRRYREFFLGSLDPALLSPEAETGEGNGTGNVVPMAEAWRRIWNFFATGREPIVDPGLLSKLTTENALDEQTQLPEVRRIRALRFTPEEWQRLVARGDSEDELVNRCTEAARELKRNPVIELKPEQAEAIRAIARREDLFVLLPTSFGKSYIYQLPALVLPGVTVIVSPLVALMTEQARSLNRSIGNAVRALVAPMRESNSRSGKQEVIDQLRGLERGIRLVYLSPERLATAQFQGPLRDAVRAGTIQFIALDEVHTFATWGDDFRPAFRRAAGFLRELRAAGAQVVGLTATARETVRAQLRRSIWSRPDRPLKTVQVPPTRPNLALYARDIAEGRQKSALMDSLAYELLRLGGHSIVYTLTIKEASRIANRLRLLVGERETWRIELFHGRLPPDEKSRILDKFKEAPHAGQEDFEPLIVVATGAFGLGIDRDDVRAVVVASPPSDLAGVFQQVGRAGRDPGSTAFGLMLASGRSLGLIEWLIRRRRGADADLVNEVVRRLLATDAEGGLDLNELAETLAAEAASHPDGKVRTGERDRLQSEIHTLAIQVLAELDELAIVEDLGDWPDAVRIDLGNLQGQTDETRAEATAIMTACTKPAHQSLGELWAATRDIYSDAGELLRALLELHAVGALEVSQAPMSGYLTGIRRLSQAPPNDLAQRLQRPVQDALAEQQRLSAFFGDHRCRHAVFADYFGTPAPQGVCINAATRCDTCWRTYRGQRLPPELHRIFTAARPAGPVTDRINDRERRQLWDEIILTLRAAPAGLTAGYLRAVLQGKDTIYRAGQPPQHLWHPLPSLGSFGSFPGVTEGQLAAAVGQLVADGRLVREARTAASGLSGYTVIRLAQADQLTARPGMHGR